MRCFSIVFASQNIQLDVEMITEPALSWPPDNLTISNFLPWLRTSTKTSWMDWSRRLFETAKLDFYCFVGTFLIVMLNSCCMLHVSGHQARCSFWRRCHCSGCVCQSIGRGWKMVEMVVIVMRFASKRCQTCNMCVIFEKWWDFFGKKEAPKKKRRKMPAGEGPLLRGVTFFFEWDGGCTTLPFWKGKHDSLGERIYSWYFSSMQWQWMTVLLSTFYITFLLDINRTYIKLY